MSKIFIYNGTGTGAFTKADSKAFFETENIIKGADVTLSDFQFNLSGLDDENPVFVVPGGHVLQMHRELLPALHQIDVELKDNYNYIGFCAGAYIAASQIDIAYPPRSYVEDSSVVIRARAYTHLCSQRLPITAIGPFYTSAETAKDYPRPGEVNRNIKNYPEAAKMAFSDGTVAHGLYIQGCGMICRKTPGLEIVATYQGTDNYSFSYDDIKSKSESVVTHDATSFASIIRKKSCTESKSGGVLLSGVHMEATVKDSQLLKNLGIFHSHVNTMPKTELKLLEEEQDATREKFVGIVRESLQIKS